MDSDDEEFSDLEQADRLLFPWRIRKYSDSFSMSQMELSKYTSLRRRRRFYPLILAVTTFVSLYLRARKKPRNPQTLSGKIGQKDLVHWNMGAAASFSSSSSLPPKKYDVFVSFRDSDIRRGFLSHLSKELRRKDIGVYVDDRVESRDDLPLAHVKAIEGSKIQLVIFSKDYASSKWCLEELVKIMECKVFNRQIVIPVFYNVDPYDVRHTRGTYRDAFAQHEQKCKVNRLQIWRSALYRAANLRGYPYSNFESESGLIENIAKEILKNLNPTRESVSVGLVGIGQHLEKIESFLKLETDAVQIIGIWGMSGMGKTTIARALYDKFSSQYERCCFLENVREESQTYGLSYLGKQLLSVLLEEKSAFLKKKLSRKKVLIVLDDVSTPKQLKYLVKEQIPLGSNSIVLVTSRDRDVLVSVGVHAIHEIQGLDFADSLELFCLNAFNRSHPEKGYKTLSEQAVDYVGGIPLALEVLGSFLHLKNIETWESTLRRLMEYPNKQIQNVLKLSYDGLDDVEKDILLDIAFFHKGKFKNDVTRLLGESDFASRGIDSLLNKALITISKSRIEMQDLIQEMCWEIVHEQCKEDLGRHTRLRDNEKVYELLKNNKGTDAIKGILLNMSQIRDVYLSPDTFQKMTNLRFLKFHSFGCMCLHIPMDLQSFSNSLRYLQWDEYPLKSLPSSFCAKNLVELHLRFSLVEKLWNGVQDLVNLRKVDLLGSKQLKELPDFSKAPNLEWLELSDCRSLCHIHPSIISLQRLVSFGLSGCKSLTSLQVKTHLDSLEQLDIGGCFSLSTFSLWVQEIMDLRFSPFSIKIVHSSGGDNCKLARLSFNGSTLMIHQVYLKSHEDPSVTDCKQLNIDTDDLCSLRELYLDGCSNFSCLSESITCLSSLQVLRLKGCSIRSLPTCIKFLEMLEMLDLSDCKRLESLSELPKSIKHLNVNNCTSLKSVNIVTSLPHKYSMRLLSLINCMELCKSGVVEADLSLQPPQLEGNTSTIVCYPGGRVPEWFKNNLTAKASITIELSLNSGDLKGFICCFVVRPFNSQQKSQISFNCQCYYEDGEKVQGSIADNIDMGTILCSDHVFLLHDEFWSLRVLRGLLDTRKDHQVNTHGQKLSFEFSVAVNGRTQKYDDLIKGCGIFPMYTSEYKRTAELSENQDQLEPLLQTKKSKG